MANNIYSIEKEDSSYNIDLFENNISTNVDLDMYRYIVKYGEEMKISSVCKSIYGSDVYIEELMRLNNIINSFNIKVNDIIYYCKVEDMEKLHTTNIDYTLYINTNFSDTKSNFVDSKINIDPTTEQGENKISINHRDNTIKIETDY